MCCDFWYKSRKNLERRVKDEIHHGPDQPNKTSETKLRGR